MESVHNKVILMSDHISPIEDTEIENWWAIRTDLKLTATSKPAEACRGADFVVIATPTDYDPQQYGSITLLVGLKADKRGLCAEHYVPAG